MADKDQKNRRFKKVLKPVPDAAPDDNFLKKAWIWNRKRIYNNKLKRQQPQTFCEVLISWTRTLVGAIIVVMIINGFAVASFVVPTGSMENTVMTGDFLFVNKMVYAPSTPQIVPFLNIPLPFYSFPGYKDPERGDVIVFIYPGDQNDVKPREFMYYLKRCVAVAGDTMHIINKQLYVNSEKIPMPPNGKFEDEDRISASTFRIFPPGKNFTRDNYGPIRVPKAGDVIALSDKNWNQWEIFIRREGHDFSFNGKEIFIDGKPVDSYTVERDYVFGMGDNRDNSEDSRYWGFVPVEDIVGSPIMVYWSWDTSLPITDFFEKIATTRLNRIGTIIR